MSNQVSLFRKRVDAMSEEAGTSGSRQPIFKPQDGKSVRIRILPGFFGANRDNWFVKVHQHWAPQANGFNRGYVCGRTIRLRGKVLDKPCLFCERRDDLAEEEARLQNEDEVDDARLTRVREDHKALNYRDAGLVQLVERDERGGTSGIQLWYMPKTVYDKLFTMYQNWGSDREEEANEDKDMKEVMDAVRKDPDDEKANKELFAYCDMFDASLGVDIIVTKKTSGKQTNYDLDRANRTTPLMKDRGDAKKIMDARFDLEKLVEDSMSVAPDSKSVDMLLSQARSRKKVSDKGAQSADDLNFGDRRSTRRNDSGDDDEAPRHEKSRRQDDDDDRDRKPAPSSRRRQDDDDDRRTPPETARPRASRDDDDDRDRRPAARRQDDDDDDRGGGDAEEDYIDTPAAPAAAPKTRRSDDDDRRPAREERPAPERGSARERASTFKKW